MAKYRALLLFLRYWEAVSLRLMQSGAGPSPHEMDMFDYIIKFAGNISEEINKARPPNKPLVGLLCVRSRATAARSLAGLRAAAQVGGTVRACVPLRGGWPARQPGPREGHAGGDGSAQRAAAAAGAQLRHAAAHIAALAHLARHE